MAMDIELRVMAPARQILALERLHSHVDSRPPNSTAGAPP
jgi:hypothetical protein